MSEFNPFGKPRNVLDLEDVPGIGVKFTIAGLSRGRMVRMDELGERIAAAEKARDEAAEEQSQIDALDELASLLAEQIELMLIGGEKAGVAEKLVAEWATDSDVVTLDTLLEAQQYLLGVLEVEKAAAPNS